MAAATYDGTDMKVYLDGVLVGEAEKAVKGSISRNRNIPVAIGDNPDGAGGGGKNFDGKIDAITVMKRALTERELADEFAVGIVVDDE